MDNNFMANVFKKLVNHSPEILTGIGVTGSIGAVILAIKDAPKASAILEKKRSETENGKLSITDIVQATWKYYLPIAIAETASVACILTAGTINAKRNAAITAAYALSSKAFLNYKEEVKKMIGCDKEKEVVAAVAKRSLDKHPISGKEIYITDDTHLCYDEMSGRYFKSTEVDIRKAINMLNSVLIDEDWVSLNSLYYELDLPSIKLGEDVGWNLCEGMIDIEISAMVADNGAPCLVLSYQVGPKNWT